MVFIHVAMSSAAKHAPILLRSVPYYQLIEEEEKSSVWFTEGSASYAGTTQTWTAIALSQAILKDTSKGKCSQ